MSTLDERIIDAQAALGDRSAGGDDNCEFVLRGGTHSLTEGGIEFACLSIECRAPVCEPRWRYSVGKIDLWELIIDAREHYEKEHLNV